MKPPRSKLRGIRDNFVPDTQQAAGKSPKTDYMEQEKKSLTNIVFLPVLYGATYIGAIMLYPFFHGAGIANWSVFFRHMLFYSNTPVLIVIPASIAFVTALIFSQILKQVFTFHKEKLIFCLILAASLLMVMKLNLLSIIYISLLK